MVTRSMRKCLLDKEGEKSRPNLAIAEVYVRKNMRIGMKENVIGTPNPISF